jgi:hypothetical protein
MHKNLLLILLVVIFLGCTTFGRPFNTGALVQIQPGKTTESEVISMLGPPDAIQRLDNGIQVFEYSYGKTRFKTSYDYLQIQFFNGVVIDRWQRIAFFG